jgi:hypothetical protein
VSAVSGEHCERQKKLNTTRSFDFIINRRKLVTEPLAIRDRMLAQIASHILKSKPIWPPSITHFRGRNPLPLLSHALGSPRIFAKNKPVLSRPCSFLHHPSAPVSAAMSSKGDHYRLPTDVRPRHYNLTIRTDLEKEKFSGFVKIECA